MRQSSILKEIDQTFHDPQICGKLLDRLNAILDGREFRFMEVCGTHTVSIFQSGLRSLLPNNIIHLSGPGCPVCVTHESEVKMFLDLAGRPNTMIATFGDLLRVPDGSGQSLKNLAAKGAKIKIVYSPLDALQLARANPGLDVVFLGIGFETTAPSVAGAIITAFQEKLANFSVLSMHKIIPPALKMLLDDAECNVDAFMLPGHVATIIGLPPFSFVSSHYGKPGVVAGFEPAELLLGLCEMARMHVEHTPAIFNAYPRAVASCGNPKAMAIMRETFEVKEALWRGLGAIPESGLNIRPKYSAFDAKHKYNMPPVAAPPLPGCKCGDILKGRLTPSQCPLFGKKCSPANPVGPCMVSTEGSCAAWHKYGV